MWTTSRNIAGSGKAKVRSAHFVNIPIVHNRVPRLREHLFESDAEDSDFEPSQHNTSEEDNEDIELEDGEGEEDDTLEEDDDSGVEYEDEWMEVIRRAERAAKNKVCVPPDSSKRSSSTLSMFIALLHRRFLLSSHLLVRLRYCPSSNILFVQSSPHPSLHISGAAMETC